MPDDATKGGYQRAEHLHEQMKVGGNRRHRHADADECRDDAVSARRRCRKRLSTRVHFFEEPSKILTQADQARFASLLRPLAHRALNQPGPIGIEIFDAIDVDRDAPRRDATRSRFDLRLNRAGVFGSPRASGAELDPVASRLATVQNPRRHRTIPPCTSQHYARVSLRGRSTRQDWLRCGGASPSQYPAVLWCLSTGD